MTSSRPRIVINTLSARTGGENNGIHPFDRIVDWNFKVAVNGRDIPIIEGLFLLRVADHGQGFMRPVNQHLDDLESGLTGRTYDKHFHGGDFQFGESKIAFGNDTVWGTGSGSEAD